MSTDEDLPQLQRTEWPEDVETEDRSDGALGRLQGQDLTDAVSGELEPAPWNAKGRRIEQHVLYRIAEMAAAGKPNDLISRVVQLPLERVKRLTSGASPNKTYDALLANARYRTEMASTELTMDIASQDMVDSAKTTLLRCMNQERDWKVARDTAWDVITIAGLPNPREQTGPTHAVQVNLNEGQSVEQTVAQAKLNEATSRVLDSVQKLTGSLPLMSDNPHISTTGLKAVPTPVVDVEPIKDQTVNDG